MDRKNWLAFASALALLPGAVVAQSGKGGDGVLEEVTVTAERKEADLQSVPISVTALSETALEQRQVTEAQDLQRYVPSLRMSNNITSPTNISPSLRGSLQQDASLVVAESPFGIYVDDVYIARLNGNNITLSDIERVEVLRGPQGTLYGRNTLAGAIKFISRTPNGDNSWFDVKAGVGNWGQFVFSLSSGGKLNDNWAASFSAQSNRKGGQVTNVITGQHVGDEVNMAGRVKLHYIGSEMFDAVLGLSYSDSTNDANQLLPGISPSVPANQRYTSDDVVLPNGDYALRTVYGTRSPSILGKNPRGETKQTIASANLAWKFDNFTIRSITGYVRTQDYFSTDFSGETQVLGASNPTSRQYSEELQISGTAMSDKLDYLAGIYYFDEKGTQDFGWNITRVFFNVGPVSSSTSSMTTKSVSVFGQGSYNFTDQLKATIGARWTQDKKTFNMRWQALFAPIPVVPIALADTYTEVTPKFGLDYKVNNDAFDSMLLYFSAARGFKSGGYNGIAITGDNDSRTSYGTESNWTYEVGAKMDALDNKLRINANYFLAKVKDLALNATVILSNGASSFPVQNCCEATIQGLELESTFVATDNLTFFMNASFLNGKFTKLDPTSSPAVASLPRLAVGVNNNRLGVKAEPPQLPNYTIALGFDYKRPFGDGNAFRLGADWYRTDDYITAATNDFVITGYDRFNMFVGLDLGDHWETKLAVKNVANDKKIYVGSRGFLGGYLELPPAEIMVTLKYKM
jgi:iron complex outermembrane recepter protein